MKFETKYDMDQMVFFLMPLDGDVDVCPHCKHASVGKTRWVPVAARVTGVETAVGSTYNSDAGVGYALSYTAPDDSCCTDSTYRREDLVFATREEALALAAELETMP